MTLDPPKSRSEIRAAIDKIPTLKDLVDVIVFIYEETAKERDEWKQKFEVVSESSIEHGKTCPNGLLIDELDTMESAVSLLYRVHRQGMVLGPALQKDIEDYLKKVKKIP